MTMTSPPPPQEGGGHTPDLVIELLDTLEEWTFLVSTGQIHGVGIHEFANDTRRLIDRAKASVQP